MTTNQTIQELRAGFSEEASGILNNYHQTIDEIRDTNRAEAAGGYFDRLTPEQVREVLKEQKLEKARVARDRALEEYRKRTEEHQSALTARTAAVKDQLFSVEGPEGAAALARAVTASEDELAGLLDVAALSGNQDLGRAVFVAAEQRGSGDLMERYFVELDPDAHDLYQEFRQAPTAGQLEQQLASVETIVGPTDPDQLMPPPRVA